MQALTFPQLRPFAKWAPLVLRLGVGIVMAAHGWQKLSGGQWQSGEMLAAMTGLPAAAPLAWLVMLVELFGGILIILGLWSRLWALLVAALMIVAIVTVKFERGLIAENVGYELDLVILAGSLAVAFLGSGALSLDQMLGLEAEV